MPGKEIDGEYHPSWQDLFTDDVIEELLKMDVWQTHGDESILKNLSYGDFEHAAYNNEDVNFDHVPDKERDRLYERVFDAVQPKGGQLEDLVLNPVTGKFEPDKTPWVPYEKMKWKQAPRPAATPQPAGRAPMPNYFQRARPKPRPQGFWDPYLKQWVGTPSYISPNARPRRP